MSTVTFGAYRSVSIIQIYTVSEMASDFVLFCNFWMQWNFTRRYHHEGYGDDVINLSLGDPGWPESATAALGDKLVTHWGMSVSASAGNDGSKGTFELSAPSVGKNVISVASVDNLCLLAFVARTASDRLISEALWRETWGFGKHYEKSPQIIEYVTENDKALNISTGVVTTLDPNNTPNLALDGCTPTTKDLTGKVALIKRGGCLFITKITTAWEAGAIAVLIFNNAPDIEAPSVPDNITIEVAGISASDGATILAEIQQGGPQGEVVFNFTEEEIEFPNPTAGTISSFSSWGLSAELDIKPDISAPGGHIFSTFPLALGGYATLSGTSMSSPQIAGVIALVLQANSDKNQISPLKIRDILLNTARPVPMYQTNTTDSVAHQGSGLVNVYDAILSKTVITPSKLELNDTAHLAFRNVYNFTISNNGDGEAIFSFDNAPAGTVKVYNQSGFFPLEKPIVGIENSTDGDLDLGVASVVFPMQSFIIPANQSANISISIFPPPAPKLDRPVIYSGYITILRTENTSDAYTITNASTLVRVPYAGISSQLRDLPILNRNAIFPTVTTPYGNPLTNASSTSFVFNSSHPAIVLYQLASPTRLLFIDAVDARNTSHSFGLIPDGLETFLGRNDPQDETDFQQVSWSGKVGLDYTTLVSEPLPGGIELLANKTKLLPAGKYRLVVRALKGFGNQTDFVDYDTWRSPVLAVGGK
ncbi:LOW QUALITY PROTEIN: hypothetical protein BC936DRAFT_145274 [Jimgerdemannia flammicorona]|uniref:Peptidase S8/S53 domain-containing protein n=1 Tax=Jimgerdemannia flammicorona TaxID=994334 RepID=A0A433DAL8_9FUNG|nr:LOW QUALITY PROTEIN: hypothetical protein BC936DRAFT_145274 [Jimgerdemannia flammicorona]